METALGESWAVAYKENSHRIGRIMQTGVYLSVLPYTINGIELGAQEWKDSLFLRYGIKTPDLPDHCDGCGMSFDICHALDCKKGGLITALHNKLCDGVTNLVSKSFTPTHVRDEPKIYTGCAVHGGKE